MEQGFYIENGKPNFSLCARCGAAIKNRFYFRGEIYGSECIRVVTGERKEYWEMKKAEDGWEIDEEATKAREAKKEQDRLDAIAAEKADIAQRIKMTERHRWLIDALSPQAPAFTNKNGDLVSDHWDVPVEELGFYSLTPVYGGFIADMLISLRTNKLRLEDNFSSRQLEIMGKIWAQYETGKKRGKIFDAKTDEFWARVADEEEA